MMEGFEARGEKYPQQCSSNDPRWSVQPQIDICDLDHNDPSFFASSFSDTASANLFGVYPTHSEVEFYEQYESAANSASTFPEAAVHSMIQDEYLSFRSLQIPPQNSRPGYFSGNDSEPLDWAHYSGTIAAKGASLSLPVVDLLGHSSSTRSQNEETRYTQENIAQHGSPAYISSPEEAPENPHSVSRVMKRCADCGSEATSLSLHTILTGHAGYGCSIGECTERFRYLSDLNHHSRAAHPELRSCSECGAAFSAKQKLSEHAEETGHAAFACEQTDCGSAFSRFDTYERHLKIHEDDVKRYPCPHCRKHRGANGFKRKDHLTQHLRNYHHIEEDETRIGIFGGKSCPHKDCPEWRPSSPWVKDHAFQKRSEYTKHMKKVHDESPFPCPEPGCDRVGGKGYFRRRDLFRHQKKEHGMDSGREDGEDVE